MLRCNALGWAFTQLGMPLLVFKALICDICGARIPHPFGNGAWVLQQGRENYLIFDVFFCRLAHGRDCDPATLVWMGEAGQPQSWKNWN